MNATRIIPPLLLILLTMLIGGAVHAQTLDPGRIPERGLQLDAELAHFGLLAVGDLDGDGRDDLVAQGVSRPGSVQSVRWLELHPGPLASLPTQATTPATSEFNVDRGASAAATTLGDMNGDGLADLMYATTNRFGIENVERQRLSIMFGRESWEPYYFLGTASRGDRKLERKMTLSPDAQKSRPSRVAVRTADLNGDGHLDLVVGIDPPAPEGGGVLDPPDPSEGESEVLITFGDGRWLFWQEADPELGREADWIDKGPLRVDVRITGLGHCARSLGDIADVTGDGRPDLLLRRCPGGDLPDLPGLVAGRDDWEAEITVPGAVVESQVMPAAPAPGDGEDIAPLPEGLAGWLGGPAARRSLSPISLAGAAGLAYLRQPEPPRGVMAAATPLLGRDLSGDGVADLLLGSGSDLHIWLGGPDIGMKLLSGRSDRIYLGASLAGAALSDAWRPADLDGDGEPELILARHVDAPADTEGETSVAPPAGPLYIYDGDWQSRQVLDLTRDTPPPASVWHDPDLALAGLADVNGDGRSDVLLATHPLHEAPRIAVLLGPVLR